VDELHRRGADLDKRDREGRTSLIWSAWQGTPNIARALIEKGADVHAQDNEGNSALMVSIAKSHNAIRNMLLEAGSTVPLPMRSHVPHHYAESTPPPTTSD
jgi:ankyrin repeat protein